MIPPLFNHSTPGAPSIARFLHTNHQNKGLIDRQSCIDIVFASCFCRPLVLHTWRTAIKCTCPSCRYTVTVDICCMLGLLFIVDGSWYLLNDLFCSSVCWSLCMRASRFRAQVPRSPRTVMARYHSRAGGCAWFRYPARSRWQQARCPSTSGLHLAPTLGRTRLEQLWSEASLNELATQQKSTDLMIDDVS